MLRIKLRDRDRSIILINVKFGKFLNNFYFKTIKIIKEILFGWLALTFKTGI